MSPSQISHTVLIDRLDWIAKMIQEIENLPTADFQAFSSDSRNIWTAESCLRRALEAIFDLSRHILAKGFAISGDTYKGIAFQLGQTNVTSAEDAHTLKVLAGYRNRLTHFYNEVSAEELFEVCTRDIGDLKKLHKALRQWAKDNPSMIDGPV